MSRAAALAVAGALIAGCHSVFGIEDLPPPDDATPPSHDEDHDGVSDSLDNCPGTANADQANIGELDGGHDRADDVGDACDPSPTKLGDRLMRFIAFADPADSARFSVVDGSWHIVDDDYVYEPPDVASGDFHQSVLIDTPPESFEVQTAMSLQQVSALGSLALLANFEGDGAMFQCSLIADRLEAKPLGDAIPTTLLAQGGELTAGLSVTVDLMQCNFGVLQPNSAHETLDPLPRFALEARGIELRVHYLALYAINEETTATRMR